MQERLEGRDERPVGLDQRSAQLYRSLGRGIDFLTETQVGPSAQWALPETVTDPNCIWRRGQILLGHFNGHLIGTLASDDRHIVTIAGTRAGKTSRVVLPNLLTYPGSVLVIDPKGELAERTAEHRKTVLRQDVHVIDPYGEVARKTGLAPTRWNPLLEIDPASREAIDDARALANAICIKRGNENEPHWIESAQALVAALILYTINLPEQDGQESPRTLQTVRDLLTLKYPELIEIASQDEDAPGSAAALNRALFNSLQFDEHLYEGFVAASGHMLEAMADKERESVLSTARTQTRFLDSFPVRAALHGQPFRLTDLKARPTSLYLCIPSRYLSEQKRLLRLIVTLALHAFERDAQTRPEWPVLFLLEEFPLFERFEEIEHAIAYLAGFGIKLWIIAQDLTQLQRHYRNSWETFLANAGVVQAFSLNGNTSLKYFSESLGATSFWQPSYSERMLDQRQKGGTGENWSRQQSPLATPRELAELLSRRNGNQLILHAGEPPRMAHLVQHKTVERIRSLEIGPDP